MNRVDPVVNPAFSRWYQAGVSSVGQFGLGTAAPSGRVVQVLNYINGLHRAIMASNADAAFKQEWGEFYRFSANYLVVALRHPTSLGTSEVQQRIEAFYQQAVLWEQGARERGVQIVAPAPAPETPGTNDIPWRTILYVALGIGGVVAIGYAVHAAAAFKQGAQRALPQAA